MFSEKDVLNAKEVYLSKNQEILIPVPDKNVGYCYSKETMSWQVTKRWCSWVVWHKAITGKEALQIIDNWREEKLEDNIRLSKAIEFAAQKHKSQFRKATVIPYIVHPMEVLQILYSMRADTNLLIAGVLHDTVEDTDTTLDEIKDMFGEDVAGLVACDSEDKGKSWDERKQQTIDDLATANQRVKMLIMADKLSNLRSIAYDYEELGNSLWERFNAPKGKQAWYYDGIVDALFDMQYFPECEKAYWELTGLFKDVFVKYYIDKQKQTIYQMCETGKVYCLKKGNPVWTDAGQEFNVISQNAKAEYKQCCNINDICENAVPVTRKQAEFTEDMWNSEFEN